MQRRVWNRDLGSTEDKVHRKRAAALIKMSTTLQRERMERASAPPMRELADQAFSRAAGAPLVEGNSVRLLIDARENYPAWLDAIADAKHHINFESYIIHEDSAGWRFADALVAKAKEGVRVRLIYDWMGGFGKTSRSFWNHLRAGGRSALL